MLKMGTVSRCFVRFDSQDAIVGSPRVGLKSWDTYSPKTPKFCEKKTSDVVTVTEEKTKNAKSDHPVCGQDVFNISDFHFERNIQNGPKWCLSQTVKSKVGALSGSFFSKIYCH